MTKLLTLARKLIPVARDAGLLEMTYYRAGERPGTAILGKADGSPVTIADQEAEKLITAELHLLAPDIPVVGEEAVAAGEIPDISGGTFFLVDALDGTREFISGGADFTVNIALLENFIPVMGVIYAPASESMYYGADGAAFRRIADGADEGIAVRKAPEKGLTIVGSRMSDNSAKMQEFLKTKNVHEFIKRSSSLKFCAVAEGEADYFPRLGPTSEWDTAAGEAILNAAGGRVTTLDGKPMVYGKNDRKFLNPGFVAFAA